MRFLAEISTAKQRVEAEAVADEIRIVLADDYPVVRKGLKASVEEEPDFRVIAEAGDGEEALQLIKKLNPTLAILDIDS